MVVLIILHQFFLSVELVAAETDIMVEPLPQMVSQILVVAAVAVERVINQVLAALESLLLDIRQFQLLPILGPMVQTHQA